MDGVDLDVFSSRKDDPALRESLNIAADEKVVVFTGMLTEYQGIDLLLEAIPLVVREVPKVKFLIVGYPNEESYRRKAQTLGVEKWTSFPGKVPYDDIPRYLSLAAVAVSPKISTTEANLKLFTYMAMGLPTVVFDSPTNREILGDVGIYAKMADVGELARALVGMLQDAVQASERGNQSQKKAIENYSWLSVGKRLIAIYNTSISPYRKLQPYILSMRKTPRRF